MASTRLRGVSAMPLVEPILLTARRDPFDDPAWLFEPKYDGYRGLLYVTRKGCWFRSKLWTARASRTSATLELAAGTCITPRSTLSGWRGRICGRCCSPGESSC